MSPTAVRRWIAAAWFAGILATVLNGLVVGYGIVWFQLFGEQADAEDYLISACAYGAATVVLALTVVGILGHGAPHWLAWVAGASSVVLGVLAADSASAMAAAPGFLPAHAWWDGIGSVLWAPWTWALLLLGLRGLFLLSTRRC